MWAYDERITLDDHPRSVGFRCRDMHFLRHHLSPPSYALHADAGSLTRLARPHQPRPCRAAVPGSGLALLGVGDADRAGGVIEHRLADRAEQHALQAAPAAVADDEQLGTGGGV